MRYTCNFCNKKSVFRSIENDLREPLEKHGFPYKLSDFETLNYKAYLCPHCGSSDRDRLYKYYIDKFEHFTKNTKILDFAPPKLMENYLRSITDNYRSADLLIDTFDDKVDITKMQYKDDTFDFFICSHVLEHVDDDRKALAELYRVLKPGKHGILMTPIINKNGVQDEDSSVSDESERWRRFAQDDHVRLYERSVFLQRVKNAGFDVTVYGSAKLGRINLLRHGISLKSQLYIVSKKGKSSE